MRMNNAKWGRQQTSPILLRSNELFGFFNLDDLLAVVIAAILAYPVGKLGLMALRASHDAGDGKLPVTASA